MGDAPRRTRVKIPVGKGKGKGRKGAPKSPKSPPAGEGDEDIRKKLVRMTLKQEELKDNLEQVSQELGATQRDKIELKKQLKELEAGKMGHDQRVDQLNAQLAEMEASMVGRGSSEELDQARLQIESLERQLAGANQARLRVEQSLEQLQGTDDLLERTKTEVGSLQEEVNRANEQRLEAEQRSKEFGVTLQEKKALQLEVDRLAAVEQDRDKMLQMAQTREKALEAAEHQKEENLRRAKESEAEAKQLKEQLKQLELAKEEQRKQAEIALREAVAAADQAHARELATVLQEAHLKYRQDRAKESSHVRELEKAQQQREQDVASSLDGLLQQLPGGALNTVLDVFEANLPEPQLDRLVERPYIQQLLSNIQTDGITPGAPGPAQTAARLLEMANGVEFDLMQAVLKKPAVNSLRNLSPSKDRKQGIELSLSGIQTALEHMQRYVEQIAGLTEARERDQAAAEARIEAAEAGLKKSLVEVAELTRGLEDANRVCIEQAERLVEAAAQRDADQARMEQLRAAQQTELSERHQRHQQEVAELHGQMDQLADQLAHSEAEHKQMNQELEQRAKRVDQSSLPLVHCVHEALLDMSGSLRGLHDRLGWCEQAASTTPFGGALPGGWGSLGGAAGNVAALLPRSRPIVFRELSELQRQARGMAPLVEGSGLQKLESQSGQLLDRACLVEPGTNIAPLSGAVTQIRSAIARLHKAVMSAGQRHEWALCWLMDELNGRMADRPFEPPMEMEPMPLEASSTGQAGSSFNRVVQAAHSLLSAHGAAAGAGGSTELGAPPVVAESVDSIESIHRQLNRLEGSRFEPQMQGFEPTFSSDYKPVFAGSIRRQAAPSSLSEASIAAAAALLDMPHMMPNTG